MLMRQEWRQALERGLCRRTQVSTRLYSSEFGAFLQGVEQRRDLGTADRFRPVNVLSSDDHPPFILPMSNRKFGSTP